jgi:radical SAM-linked protein
MLAEQAIARADEDRVSVSLPSLRLDSFSVEMADMVGDVRRSGLTFAPEAATPRMRAVINKWIPDEGLLEMSAEAYKRGWNHVKCYFMIGLPTERDEDVEAIIDLCARTLEQGRAITPKASVRLGVSTFVPKPFTPFQWAPQIDIDETERKQGILDRGFRRYGGAIKFGRHTAETTFIEGLITRSDRRAGDLIEAAWKRGARFESWDERCDIEKWHQAIEDVQYDVAAALRERDLDERLPWDHIDVLMPKEWFQEDWQRAMELKHAQDCRAGKCHLCGVIYRERDLCKHMLKNQKRGRAEEQDWTRKPRRSYEEPPAVQRLRFRIGRKGEARWLSHLELMSAWVRALRRANAPLSYSQGFHAHPKVNFATAPPVGEESLGDYMDIVLKKRVDALKLFKDLKTVLPEGFRVFECEEVPLKAPALMSVCAGFDYTIHATADADTLQTRIAEMLASDELLVERRAKVKTKKGKRRLTKQTKEVNVRPMIQDIQLRESKGGAVEVDVEVRLDGNRSVRTSELLKLLGLVHSGARVVKRATLLADSATL